MDLLLVRHAEAEPGGRDFDRRLTAKGKKDAEKVARWLLKRIPVDFRLCSSPLVRARETAAFFMKEAEIMEELQPSCYPQQSLKALLRGAEEDGCIVAVGHQPLTGATAGHLLGLNESLKTKKAGVWWFKGEPGNFELHCVVSPGLV